MRCEGYCSHPILSPRFQIIITIFLSGSADHIIWEWKWWGGLRDQGPGDVIRN